MRREPAWRRYLRFWGASPERDVDDEFRFHFESKIEELRSTGLSAEEARRRALREFGPVDRAREECVEIGRASERRRSWSDYFDGWWADVRFAARVLRKSKASTGAAIVILAVGIGATTSVFTLLDRMMLAPLPVKNPAALRFVGPWAVSPAGKHLGGQRVRQSEYAYLRDHQSTLEGLAAEGSFAPAEQHGREKIEEPARGVLVTGNYFDILGVTPFAGRTLQPSDDVWMGGPQVAVVSYRFASRRYQSPRDAVGQTLFVSDQPYTIVGVTVPGFFGIQKGYDFDFCLPIGHMPLLFRSVDFESGSYFHVFGRLRAGVDDRRAQAEMQFLWDQVRTSGNSADHMELEDAARGENATSDQEKQSMEVLSAIVGVLLLIGCANIGCLMVARGAARQHETAIRLSLGAGRMRILRGALLESGLLAVLGGLAAMAVAQPGTRLLVMAFHWQKRPLDLSPDLRVLLFAVAVSTLAAVLFGLAPAVQLLRGGRVALTQEHAVAPFSSGKLLVSLEVALSLVLVAGAAVFVRSFQNLRSVPVGFAPDHVSIIRLTSSSPDDADSPPIRRASVLAEALRRESTVVSATLANFVVFNDSYVLSTVRKLDDPKPVSTRTLMVAPGYWETMRVPILAGHGFTERDTDGSRKVAVINESLAQHLFPGQVPLGKSILTGRAVRNPKPGDEVEIVGVAANTKFSSVVTPAPDAIYLPLRGEETHTKKVVLAVRSGLEPPVVGALVGARIRQAHLSLEMEPATAMDDEIGASLRDDAIRMRASSLFGGLALVLVAAGLYGLMAYTVARRTREIGIRMAVGSGVVGIVGLVVRQSLRLVLVGIAIGIPGAVMAMRALSGMVFALPPVDYVSLVLAATLLAGTALAASFAPAWRAAHLDPMKALRVQ